MQSSTNSHIFTYNVSTQPLDKLLLNIAFSKQLNNTKTPTGSNAVQPIPGFNADVDNALVSSSYFPTENLSITNIFSMTWSRNFNNRLPGYVPYGVSNTSKSGSVGIKWSPKDKDYSIEPHYSYYSYNGNSVSEIGDYSAHVAWLDVKMDW